MWINKWSHNSGSPNPNQLESLKNLSTFRDLFHMKNPARFMLWFSGARVQAEFHQLWGSAEFLLQRRYHVSVDGRRRG